jgi:hypothetical protein
MMGVSMEKVKRSCLSTPVPFSLNAEAKDQTPVGTFAHMWAPPMNQSLAAGEFVRGTSDSVDVKRSILISPTKRLFHKVTTTELL